MFDYENFLLRGSSLRNTEFVIGIAVYVGADTRIMRNSAKSRMKQSKLERIMNYQLLFTCIIEFVLCLSASSYVLWWNKNRGSVANTYLGFYPFGTPEPDWTKMREFLVFIKTFGTWFLLFTQMVPISVLVSLEIVRFFQKKIIQSDVSIYCTKTDAPTRVQSCNLNEELGQIDYIFSDKTGTLTCNLMEFRKLSAGLKSYGSNLRLTDEEKID